MDVFVVSTDEILITALTHSIRTADGERMGEARVCSWETAAMQISGQRAGDTPLLLIHFTGFDESELQRTRELLLAAQNRAHVVGIGTARNPKLILDLIRNGLFDFVEYDTPETLHADLRNVVKRITARRSEGLKSAKIIAVIGAAGGTGASTIACNIASVISTPTRSCILIDMDIGGGVQAMLLNASPRYTIASLAGKSEQLDASLFDRALLKHASGIHLLAAPDQVAEARAITRDLLSKVIQLAQQAAPWVVVDIKSVELAEQIRLLPHCEKILLPLRPDYVSLQRTKRSLDYLLRAKVAADRIEVVLNRAGQQRELPLSCLEKALGVCIEHRLVDDSPAANSAYNLGTPVVVASPTATLAKQLTKLGRRLAGDVDVEMREPLLNVWKTRLNRWSKGFFNVPVRNS